MTPAPQRPFGLLWVVLITILALFAGLLIQLPAGVVEVLSDDDAVAFYVNPEWLERIGFATAIVLYAAAFVGLPLFFLRRRRSQDLIGAGRSAPTSFGPSPRPALAGARCCSTT